MNKTAHYTLRIAPEVKADWKAAAAEAGVPLSEYVETAVQRQIEADKTGRSFEETAARETLQRVRSKMVKAGLVVNE